MRKVQEKLINRAIQNNYSESIIELLSDESISVKTLQVIYNFLRNFKEENVSKDKLFDLLQLSEQFTDELNIQQQKEGNSYRYSDLYLIDMFSFVCKSLETKSIGFDSLYDNISNIVASNMPVREKSLKIFILRDNDEEIVSDEEAFDLLVKYPIFDSFSYFKTFIIDSFLALKQECNYEILNRTMNDLYSNPNLQPFRYTLDSKITFYKNYIFAKANGVTLDEFLKILHDDGSDSKYLTSSDKLKWFVAEKKYFKFFEYIEGNCFKSDNIDFKDYTSGRYYSPLAREWFFLDIEILSLLEAASNLIMQKHINSRSFSVQGSALRLRISVSYTGVSFCFMTGNKYNVCTCLDEDDNENVVKHKKVMMDWQLPKQARTLFFPYNEENIYIKNHEKFTPGNIRMFSALANRESNRWFDQVYSFLLRDFVDRNINNGCYTFKDLLTYFENDEYSSGAFPPIKISDAIKYSGNLNMLMQSVYKTANFVNWNRCNLIYCYSLMKIRNKITSQSWDYLQNGLNDLSHDKPFNIVRYLEERIQKSDMDVYFIVSDYVAMCRQMKRKINLLYTSESKLRDAHDELAVKYREKYTPVIKIPKGSKFLKLRKILLEEFEWIKTRKRICKEGEVQHNCVASYADDVNKDRCAIYSLVRDGNRYTIEFQKYENRYTINQLFGVCNSDAPDEVFDYVSSFITQGASA